MSISITYFRNGNIIGSSIYREDYNEDNIKEVKHKIKLGMIGSRIKFDDYTLSDTEIEKYDKLAII